MDQGRVDPWPRCQLITGPYVNNCGFITLLKYQYTFHVFVSTGSGTEHLPLLSPIRTDWATATPQNWQIFTINQKPTVQLFWLSVGCFQQNHPPWISISEGGWGSPTSFNTTVHRCGHNLLYLLCQHLPNLVIDTWSNGCPQAEEVVLSEYVGLWNCWAIWQVLAVWTSLGYPGGKNSVLGVVREGHRKCPFTLKKSQENGGFPSSTCLNFGGEVLSKVNEFKFSLQMGREINMCLCFGCPWIPP